MIFFRLARTTSVYSSTKCRVFHNGTFFRLIKHSHFTQMVYWNLNAQLQDQSVNGNLHKAQQFWEADCSWLLLLWTPNVHSVSNRPPTTLSHTVPFQYSPHLCHGLPTCLFLPGLTTRTTWDIFLFAPTRVICHAHCNFPDFITLIMFAEDCKPYGPQLRNSIQFLATYSFWGRNISLGTPFSKTVNAYSINIKHEVSTPYKRRKYTSSCISKSQTDLRQ